jgi:hypothetical protein
MPQGRTSGGNGMKSSETWPGGHFLALERGAIRDEPPKVAALTEDGERAAPRDEPPKVAALTEDGEWAAPPIPLFPLIWFTQIDWDALRSLFPRRRITA